MKKMLKILVIMIAVSVLNFSFYNISFAAVDSTSPQEMVEQGKAFIDKGKEIVENNHIVDANDISGPITEMAQVATTIGAGILLCVIAYMGIKWLQAKPDEQAKLKEQTIGVLVAGIVILGGYSIWSIAIDIVKNL